MSHEASHPKRRKLSRAAKARLAALRQMPKPKVDDVVLSVDTQWKYVLLTGLLFPAAAGVFYLLSIYGERERLWFGWAVATLAVGLLPALIGGLMALWVSSQSRKLRQMTDGAYFVHWKIDDEQWRQMFEQLERKFNWVPLMVTGLLMVGGMTFAFLIWGDGDIFFGSTLMHFVGFGMIFIAAGAAISFYVWMMGGVTRRLMRTHTPQVVIGPAGVYYTAQFWPLLNLGQHMTRAERSQVTPGFLRFEFSIATEHGSQEQSVLVPYPPQEAAGARMVCALMKREIRRR